jgi:hypothetical protein
LRGSYFLFGACSAFSFALVIWGGSGSQAQGLLAVFEHGISLSIGAIVGFSK